MMCVCMCVVCVCVCVCVCERTIHLIPEFKKWRRTHFAVVKRMNILRMV